MNCIKIQPRFERMLILLVVLVMIFYSLGTDVSFAAEKPVTVSVLGDCILGYKVSTYENPGFKKLVDIIRATDCTLGNCEVSICEASQEFPAYKDFDPNVYVEPWGADEFKWVGIDLMSLSNNHSMDFDYNGLFATLHHLDRVNIKYAGAGKNLEHAGKAGVFSSTGGPVALISCCSWIPEPNSQASLSHPYMKGRPGINPVNVEMALQVDKKKFIQLKQIYDTVLKELDFAEEIKQDKEVTKFKFGEETTIIKGDKTDLLLIPEKRDIERIKKVIQVAKRNNRIVIVTIHEHIGGEKQKKPTKFQKEFARTCIDAGADIFCGTGPHQLWGIEMYKGKPIFHSLGNFFFHMPLRMIAPEAYQRFDLPPDTLDPRLYEDRFAGYFKSPIFWESVVPIVLFNEQNQVSEIKLYPVELGQKDEFYRRGTPRIAKPERAKSIFKRLSRMSGEYKTRISVKAGIGKVEL